MSVPAWEGRALERSLAAAADRSSARARRLVDAARSLAARRGSSDFTMAEVAAEAKVSLRSVYRHFSGRDDLLLALFEEEARHGAVLLEDAMEDAGEPLERVRRYVVGLCELMITGSGYASLLVREHIQLGQRRPDELRLALAPLLDLLAAELAAAAANGDIRTVDHHDAAIVFSAVLAHAHAVPLFARDEERAADPARLWEFCRAALALSPTEESA